MWDQEKHHLIVMDKLRVQHQVRPTILSDIAKTAGFGLGVATALMGKEAAMACTEAVETVIGEHYDEYGFLFPSSTSYSSRSPVNSRKSKLCRPHTLAYHSCPRSFGSSETMNLDTSILQWTTIPNEHLRMPCSAQSLVAGVKWQ